ncbi:hypothetical protein M430DRAFT_215251 [Amorphotheca resinae ATCC 22711]|uniref:RING-type domain-containing protein n=1 Tax=Amorphotheca resinae ATCC 22711 TaxID=857342 RepID=A0A2T3B8S3_AMORE|nr:hypothetical protein M430DRAFT_215251 [Amorphotheca resinae ATCC 22711]PSS23264.1 hypothetical protein M430DRAFT_215251 [Amorphotheca resinae ATCC 22711]
MPSSLIYSNHDPSPSVTCPICLDPVTAEAVRLSCHLQLHCSECIGYWLGSLVAAAKRVTCPKCREAVTVENLRAPEQNVEWQDPDGDEYDYDYDDYDDYDDTEVEEENRDSEEDQDEDGYQSSDIEDGLNYYGADQDENEDLISGEMGEDIDAYEEDEGGIFERDPDEDEDQMSDEMKGTESEEPKEGLQVTVREEPPNKKRSISPPIGVSIPRQNSQTMKDGAQ